MSISNEVERTSTSLANSATAHRWTTLLERTGIGRANNINALRLLLSLMVLFQHAYNLAWGDLVHDPLYILTQGVTRTGALAVDLFFVLSGFLIAASFQRSKSLEDFMKKRVLRIYPGFIAAMFVTVALAAARSPHFRPELLQREWIFTFTQNLLQLGRSSVHLPVIFTANPWYFGEANGSLWTIQHEFLCYVVVAALGVAGLLRFRWLILALLALCYTSYLAAYYGGVDISMQDRRLLTHFLLGVSVWLWREKIPLNGWAAAAVFIGLLFANRAPTLLFALLPFGATYIFFCVAYAKPVAAFKWCDRWDLSYGVYLYSFIIQQVIASFLWGRTPGIILALSIPISLGFALCSWTIVEKPFLRLKRSTVPAPEAACA